MVNVTDDGTEHDVNAILTDVCVLPGDSGGSAVVGQYAVGITSGGKAIYFAADVIGNATGKTGLIGATLTSTDVSMNPEPTAVVLLFTIVAIMFVPAARRFRKQTAA